MPYNLNVNVIYEENCEYKESQSTKIIPLTGETQTILMSININGINIQTNNENEIYTPITIGEECIFTIECTHQSIPIKTGYIQITDESGIKNPIKCFLNNNGMAIIKYVPKNIGRQKIIITYEDNNSFFNTQVVYVNIEVKPIDVYINFEYPKVIASPKENVTLKARITKDAEGTIPMTYGQVTFSHYSHYTEENEDRSKEKVIGNPTYVDENGYASINYIPMQDLSKDDDVDEKDLYIEYVKASYDYDYNQYYSNINKIGYIFIKRDNTISIEGLKEESPLEIPNDYKWAIAEPQDNINFRTILISESNLNFTEDSYITLHIDGTIIVPNKTIPADSNDISENDNINYTLTEYNKTIKAYRGEKFGNDEWYNFNKYYDEINDEYYDYIHLSPGFYDIYASTNTLDDETSTVKYSIDTTHEQYSDGNIVDSKKYLEPIEESMHYYLQINYNDYGNDIQMEIVQSLPDRIKQEERHMIQFALNVQSENQANMLFGKKCYLYSNAWNNPIITTIDNNNYNDNNIIINFNTSFNNINVGKYYLYAYIEGFIENNEYIPSVKSEEINFEIIGDMTPSIGYEYINEYYPGAIKYIASLSNIKDDIINGIIYNYKKNTDKTQNNYIKNIQFDTVNDEYEYEIYNLEANEYYLELDVNNTITQKTYTIHPSQLYYRFINDNEIIGINPSKTKTLILTSQGGHLTEEDFNNFTLLIKEKDDSNNFNNNNTCTIIDKYITDNNTTANIIFTTGKYTENEWLIQPNMNNMNFIDNQPMSLKTTLLKPNCKIEKDKDNNITINVSNGNESELIPIIVEISFNEDVERYIAITNEEKEVILVPDSENKKEKWNYFSDIKLIFNPTHEDIISALINMSSLENINGIDNVYYGVNIENPSNYEEFSEIENSDIDTDPTEGYTIDVEEEDISGIQLPSEKERIMAKLRNQLSEYENTYLFTTLGQYTIKLGEE